MRHPVGRRPPSSGNSPQPVPPVLHVLQVEIASCTTCPSLKPWRRFGPAASGNASTGYLLVGEAPGYVSWKKRRRFTGPAGMVLRRALKQVDHPRCRDLEDLFYMTDVVKCHPSPPGNPTSNRAPWRVERETCAHYLVREIQALSPSVIVAFGKAAADGVAQAVKQASGSLSPLPRMILFPHPSPRNQRTILTRYPSMIAFERALTSTFRELIVKLEARKTVK